MSLAPRVQQEVVLQSILDLPVWSYVLDRHNTLSDQLEAALLHEGFVLLKQPEDVVHALAKQGTKGCIIDCRERIPDFVQSVLRRYGGHTRIVCMTTPKTHSKWDAAVPEFRQSIMINGHTGTRVNYQVL